MAKQYKLLAGGHAVGREKFHKGDVITSEIALDEVFGKDKFQLIHEPVVTTTPKPPKAKKKEIPLSHVGPKNVASSFRGLSKYIEDGLTVLEKEDGFWIYDDNTLVNSEPLKKSKVKAAVVDHFG